MKAESAILAMSLVALAACSASRDAASLRTYRNGVSAMMDRPDRDVADRLTKEWNFELLHHWEAENPTVATARANNYRTHGFSPKEAGSVFAAPGTYSVQIFLKLLASETVRTGRIDQSGLEFPESKKEIAEKRYAYIRVVFRDKRLAHFTVWQ
jgi:hypothetical protein